MLLFPVFLTVLKDHNIAFLRQENKVPEPMVTVCPGRPDSLSLVQNYFNSDLYKKDTVFETEVNSLLAKERRKSTNIT